MTFVSTMTALAPSAWWRLGEPFGTIAADASGNARNGAYQSSPTLGATSLLAGDTDTAMTLADNSGQCMSVASAAWMNATTAFSAFIRVKLTSGGDGTNGDAILSRYGSGGFPFLLWRNTAAKWAVQINAAVNCTSPSTVTVSQTYSLGFTYDGATIRLYVDGVEVATAAYATPLASSTRPIEIGRYSGSNVTIPGGTFDEAAVWVSTVLTPTDMADLHAAALESGDIAGTLDADLPAIVAEFAGEYVAPTGLSGQLAATLPKIEAEFTGTYTAPVLAGTLDAELPAIEASFTGASPIGTDVSNGLAGISLEGSGDAFFEVPVAPVPPGVSRGPRVDKAIAYPTPTMIDGRPT